MAVTIVVKWGKTKYLSFFKTTIFIINKLAAQYLELESEEALKFYFRVLMLVWH